MFVVLTVMLYVSTPEEGGEVVGIVDSRSRQAVLVGLTPDTLYAITVRAYNKRGASPSSPPIYIRTDLTGRSGH